VIQRPLPTLRGRALMWLSQREHSRAELRAKLRRWAADPDEPDDDTRPAASDQQIEALLDELAAARHLSDERFVESRIHARAARFGDRRIQQELRRHGVQVDDATRARLHETELARAKAVHARKFMALPASPAERARQTRFLAARGFSAETIRRILSGADEDT
jgi:regulatory protein